MNSLPMAPGTCSLDEADLGTQLARYRSAGRGADIVEQSPARLVVRVGAISHVAVEELIAVERRCCPFFDLKWEPTERRLSISVSRREDEPALESIADALGLRDAADARGRASPIDLRQ
jgi:hypothetical protein